MNVLDLPIEADSVLIPVYAVSALLVLVLLTPRLGLRRRTWRWWAALALAAGAGALLASAAVWIVVDVQDVFGAPASAVIRGAAAGAGAGSGVAVVNLVSARWWRRVVAVLTIPAVLIAGALIINRDVAYYPKLGDALGDSGVGALTLSAGGVTDSSLRHWTAPAGMPVAGTVGTVRIPGTVSHWHGREAWVYEPPAALVAHPPKLPVLIAFSGQPGGPSDLFEAGNVAATMNAIAAAHEGVAPIVVVPDQLGAYNVNPMCVNSRMGDVARYVTVDVRDWILEHLPVSTARREWTVGGFSEGGTCAVQFGTEYPALFGSFIAVSPELGPIDGSVKRSVREAFHHSLADYEAAQPIAIMHRKGPYRDTFAAYSVGALDTRYGADAPRLAAASRAAGMHVAYRLLPGVAHNWNTGAEGLAWGADRLVHWWGLP